MRALLYLLMTIHASLLAWSATRHSPTLNEPGHLAAGISHWQFGRFELYRVNPPLVRMIAALPVLAAGVETDWSQFHEGPGARPVFAIGEDLIAANGRRSLWLFTIARWACIPLSLVGGVVCFLWARDLYGPRAGLAAAALWCFSPNILGHASLITADAPAAALGLAACYTFWRWLVRPTWSQTFLTGLVLGVAELAKTTLIVFYPLWPLLWVLYRLPDRMGARQWGREAAMLLVRMAIGVYVINLGYGFEGSMQRLDDYSFVSSLFTGEEGRANGNRLAGTHFGQLPVPFPKNYVLGIDVQRRDFERYSRPSYLRGEFRQTGWWYYYLYALGIKVPLGTWGLLVLVVVARLAGGIGGRACQNPEPGGRVGRASALTETLPADGSDAVEPFAAETNGRRHSQRGSVRLRDELVLLFPAVVILALVSSQTGFSEHMRYVLPMLPFVFVWISQFAPPVGAGRLAWRPADTLPAEAAPCDEHAGDALPAESLAAELLAAESLATESLAAESRQEEAHHALARRTDALPARSCRIEPVGTGQPHSATPSGSRLNRWILHCFVWHAVLRARFGHVVHLFVFLLLFGWSVASSLSVYPHSLSYFNELAGGPAGGPDHLLSSNVDWGQDLVTLKEWVDRHPDAGPLYLAYYGYYDPAHFGLVFSAPLAGTADEPTADHPGVYAVSVNFLRGCAWSAFDGQGRKTSYGRDALARFRRATPIARAGYSIVIFRVPPET